MYAGTVLGVVLVAALVRGSFARVPAVLAGIAPGWLAGTFALVVAANLVRARRMRDLLSVPVSLPDAFAVTCSYNIAAAVLPAGLGELVLPLRLARRHGCPRAEAASTLLLTRLLDLLGLLAAALLSALVLPGLGGYRLPAVVLSATALVLAAVVIFRLCAVVDWAQPRLSRLATGRGRWRPGAARVLGLFSDALAAQRRRATRTTITDTVLMWGLVWVSVVAEVRAVGPGLPLAAGGLTMAAVFLLTAIPLRAVAGIGLQEAGWVLVLTAFAHLERGPAAAAAVAVHVVTLATLAALWPIGALVGRAGQSGPVRRVRRR